MFFSVATDIDLSQNETQSESTTEISSLQYAYDQLLRENQRLQAEQAASSTDTRELIQGLKTIVSEATPKPKPKEPKDPEPTGPNLPDCYDQIKPVVKKDNTGPAIAQNIADLLKIAWHNVLPGDDIVKLLDDQVRPENCDAVKPLVVNTEVHLSKQDRSSEKNMRYVGNAVCGAGKCLAYLMDMFATAEADVRSKDPDADGWLVNDQGVSLDLPKANKLLINMARLLGTANVQTGQARRSMLIHKFKEQFKKLCVRSNHFTDGMFFGPDFNAAMALISDATKVQTTAFQQKRKSSDFSRSPKWKKSNSYADFSQSQMLQAAVMQQALQAARPPPASPPPPMLPGALGGVPQYPFQPQSPQSGIPWTAPPRGRGRGQGNFNRGRPYSKKGRGRGSRSQ